MKDLHQVLFYFDVLPFLSLLLSFLPSFFSPVAHFRLRSAASGLKATLRVSSLPAAGPLCQTDRTYSHAENAGCGHEVYLNQTPQNCFIAAVNPTLKTLPLLAESFLWLIYSSTVKPPFWEKITKKLFPIRRSFSCILPLWLFFFFVFFLEVVEAGSDFALLHLSYNRAGVLS